MGLFWERGAAWQAGGLVPGCAGQEACCPRQMSSRCSEATSYLEWMFSSRRFLLRRKRPSQPLPSSSPRAGRCVRTSLSWLPWEAVAKVLPKCPAPSPSLCQGSWWCKSCSSAFRRRSSGLEERSDELGTGGFLALSVARNISVETGVRRICSCVCRAWSPVTTPTAAQSAEQALSRGVQSPRGSCVPPINRGGR